MIPKCENCPCLFFDPVSTKPPCAELIDQKKSSEQALAAAAKVIGCAPDRVVACVGMFCDDSIAQIKRADKAEQALAAAREEAELPRRAQIALSQAVGLHYVVDWPELIGRVIDAIDYAPAPCAGTGEGMGR